MWFFAPGAPCSGYGRKQMRKSIAGFSSRSEANFEYKGKAFFGIVQIF